MEYFQKFVSMVASMPDLVSLLICPALLLVAGTVFAVLRLKKAYPLLAVGLGGAGAFFVACEGTELIAAYLGLYVVLAVLVRLLFLIPFRTKRGQREREEEIYSKFHVDLAPEEEPIAPSEEETYDAEESGLRLGHVESLLRKLQESGLTASDRLEADAIARSLDVYRDRPLTADEMRSLNDCLASVLKLTAKYKL